jgi:hypothetical protein
VGAKTWILVYAEGDVREVLRGRPTLDRDATRALVGRLHPHHQITEIEDSTLLEGANPPDGQVHAGCFPGVTVLCTGEVGIDHPSRLDRRFLEVAEARPVYLHAMHSVVDWFAFAIWKKGELVRALSLSPDSGILENLGTPLPFESPYWAGQCAASMDEGQEPYPLPFHPLEMAESALRALFGFTYEGTVEEDDPDLESIPLAGFAVRRRSGLRGWLAALAGKRN